MINLVSAHYRTKISSSVARTSVLPYLGIILSNLTNSSFEQRLLLAAEGVGKLLDGRLMRCVPTLLAFVGACKNMLGEACVKGVSLGNVAVVGRTPDDGEIWNRVGHSGGVGE